MRPVYLLIVFFSCFQVVEVLSLKDLNRDEINELVLKQGFYKKDDINDPVPEEYKEGPYQKQEL